MFRGYIRSTAAKLGQSRGNFIKNKWRKFSDEAHKAHEEHEKTAEFWKKATIYGVFPVLAVVGTGELILHMVHHEHHEETPAYPYLRIRRKPFPWHCSDCNLFDRKCHRACREAEKQQGKSA